MNNIQKISSKESSKKFYTRLESFNDYSQGRNIALGSLKVGAVTTLQRLSLPLDAAKLCAPWGKVAVYNNATGQTVTIKKLTVSVRRVM